MSRTQIEKLGRRLVAAERPAPEDVVQLNELLIAYREVLNEVVARVSAVTGLPTTSRVKTRSTTLDKLRRNPAVGLPAIQDLAGTRIVVPTRREQDVVVETIRNAFLDGEREPQVVDRRENPSHGYRAVHVVAFVERAPAEIQVRTRWQHEWAELFEKFADRAGREIRYGGPPAVRGPDLRLAELIVEFAVLIADRIHINEQIEALGALSAAERTGMEADLMRLRGHIDRFGR